MLLLVELVELLALYLPEDNCYWRMLGTQTWLGRDDKKFDGSFCLWAFIWSACIKGKEDKQLWAPIMLKHPGCFQSQNSLHGVTRAFPRNPFLQCAQTSCWLAFFSWMKHTHTLLNQLIYTRLFLFLHCVPISPDTLEKATTTTTISDLVSYDDIKKAIW